MQPLGTAGNLLGTAAEKVGVQINGTAVQRCRHGHHLEGGARLIAIGNTAVAPLLQSGSLQSLFVFCLGIGPRLASLGQILITAPQRLYPGCRIRVCDFQIPVGIVASQRGHSQNLPGLAVHHQTECAVLHIVAGNGSGHLLFQTPLHHRVQCKDHIISGQGSNVIFIGKGHIHFVVALGGNDLAGAAGQEGIIGSFNALAALPCGIGKANHLSRQLGVGVDPPGGGL